MTAIHVPLRHKQIEAAQSLYDRYMHGWCRSDEALDELHRVMPGFDGPVVLVKAATVDNLYSANVYYIDNAAQRIGDVLSGVGDVASAGPDLVENLAAVTVPTRGTIHYRSFASKFAHFFINRDRFPVYDRFAIAMLRAHLGTRALPAEGAGYTRFHDAFWRLADSVGPDLDTRHLDRYLWIVGQYREWRKTPKGVNSEARGVFEADPPELQLAVGPFGDGR